MSGFNEAKPCLGFLSGLPAGVVPLQKCVGYDWPIPFSLQDANGNPLDLPGEVSAELFITPASPALALAVTNNSGGSYETVVAKSVTAGIVPQGDYSRAFPTRVVISVTSGGLISPVKIILIQTLDPQSTLLLS